MPTALKLAVLVGSLLLCIDRGDALLRHEMTLEQWLSVGLTYLMPYLVNIHGQYTSFRRLQ